MAAATLGATSQLGFAGCGGGTDGPTPIPGDGETTADSTKLVSRIDWSWAVGDTEFNRFSAASNYPVDQTGVFFDPMVSYSPTENRFLYDLSDGAPYMDGCDLHVPLKDTYTWWDGEPVTARDREVLGHIVPYFCCGGPEEVPWESVMVSEYEFKEQKVGEFNEAFASINMMQGIRAKASYWESYLERLQDASTSDAVQTIVKEIRDKQVTMDEFIEEGLGYGLWKPVDYTSSSVTLEKYEDHPQADKTDLEEWEWRVINTDQSFYQAFAQDRFDLGQDPVEQNVQNVPEDIETVVEYAGRFGRKLGINWRNKHLARRPVRRALNYVIDREALTTILPDVSAVSQQTGSMPDSLVEKWVGPDFLDQIIDYGTSSKREQAAQVLREAGYERGRNDIWTDPDGDRIEGLRFIAESGSDTALLGDTISGLLSDFGIETSFSTLEPGTYQNIVDPRSGSGDFDLSIHEAGPNGPHPSRMWDYVSPRVVDNFQIPANIDSPEGCSIEAPSVEWIDDSGSVFNVPVNPAPAFPGTVGAESIDGEGQRVNPIKAGARLRFAIGDEEIRRISRRLAWWVNFNAFHVYLHSFERSLWMDTTNFAIGEDATIRGISMGSNPMSNGDVSSR
jgi:hypothetical protein